MLGLLAFGLIATELVMPIETVDVPSERTATLAQIGTGGSAGASLPNGAAAWRQALDPADRTPFAFDWSSLLAEGEKIDSIVRLTVSATAVSLGVKVDDTAGRLPALDTAGKTASLWALVDPAFQSNAAFLGTGVPVGIAMLIRTDSSPQRELERTSILTVRQQ